MPSEYSFGTYTLQGCATVNHSFFESHHEAEHQGVHRYVVHRYVEDGRLPSESQRWSVMLHTWTQGCVFGRYKRKGVDEMECRLNA